MIDMEDVSMMTSADVLDATAFEDSGIVMGFGYVGMEMVPYLAEAGEMDLTVIEHDSRPLDEADPAFGDALLSYYRDAFDITVLTETDERRVEPTADGGVRMSVRRNGHEETIEADQLFGFTGRRPAVDNLGLEQTSLNPEPGWVPATMQARGSDRIFVAGDANGREPILHVAKEQGVTAAENIRAHAAGDELTSYQNIHHHVVFSGLGVLPYARVGHSVESAEASNHDFITVTREAASDGVFKSNLDGKDYITMLTRWQKQCKSLLN
jgi:dihydrolipoamide dehydrogenase